MTRTFSFRVDGIPAPQGSKRHVGNGRMIEMSKKVGPWRDRVFHTARRDFTGEPFDGPLEVSIVFYLARPKTVTRAYPSVVPDIDKLDRSTNDALTIAGVITDDARIVDLHLSKRYGEPGADITVSEVEA